MRIMVFDVPAESGGALSILNEYYENAVNHKDKSIEWIFVVSKPDLKPTDNVKILRYPWIKKSWFHRLYFDYFIAPKLVYKYDADSILSLQNLIIPRVKVRQTLYLHQSLPFVKKRYGITKNFKFWVYQNIISRMIYKSIKEADKVIVQTKWIMNAAIEKTKTKKEKFLIKQPELNIEVKEFYKFEEGKNRLFFYPASGFIYKNHNIIVQACRILRNEGIENYNIIFTLKGDENNHIKKLYSITRSENLPINFIGFIDIDTVYKYYSKSTLIFPSYIETFGLPLLEAKMHKSPILASDCEFSHEILDDYDKVRFFDPFNPQQLAEYLKQLL